MKTILLKFAGPLQSWGTSSHFEIRHTDAYPSKSAVIGLIAASLGYRRDDEDIIALNNIQFAVRIDQPGHVTYDYQTAHAYKPNGEPKRTYVTERYYLEDAVFIVAIGSDDDHWMDDIEYALKHPYFQLYLGRRSVPVTADFILKETNQDVITSLKEAHWEASKWYKKRMDYHAKLPVFYDVALKQSEQIDTRRDYVNSFSFKGRQYSFRDEARMDILVEEYDKSTEHDAFGAIGG